MRLSVPGAIRSIAGISLVWPGSAIGRRCRSARSVTAATSAGGIFALVTVAFMGVSVVGGRTSSTWVPRAAS